MVYTQGLMDSTAYSQEIMINDESSVHEQMTGHTAYEIKDTAVSHASGKGTLILISLKEWNIAKLSRDLKNTKYI